MLLIYCDGGTRKGRGAWAYIIVRAPAVSIISDYAGKLAGPVVAHGYGVHNRALHSSHMELVAAHAGIERAFDLPKAPLTLVSDSTYVVDGMLKPAARMQSAKMSVKGDYTEIAELWKNITLHSLFREIPAQHVKGHRQQTGNTFCDWMCNQVLDNRTDDLDHKVHLFNNSRPWRASLIRTRK